MDRYRRQIIIPQFGEEGQRAIRQASVLVVGVGGLGSAICPYLVGAGIGQLKIIDADTVALHNLQRQVLYREPQIGLSKAEMAKKTLSELNSQVQIEAYNEWFSRENATQLVQNVDIVIDASDNYATRYLINDVCVTLDKPFIYGAICELEGQMALLNYKKGATYRCLFPDEAELTARPKKELGVIGILPAIVACWQVNEVFKLLCNYGNLMNDKLFYINLIDNSSMIFDIIPSQEQRQKALFRV
ncbi:MAG: HesA/MoeB/ThiF family protein [Bacteroidales bacterium]|jgi:adenylyltransferase/sulfurtransferase|nr:HesA/MoeB/ThiF family protein [Bacteroidales bacterium]